MLVPVVGVQTPLDVACGPDPVVPVDPPEAPAPAVVPTPCAEPQPRAAPTTPGAKSAAERQKPREPV
jgi:hypothetical protein